MSEAAPAAAAAADAAGEAAAAAEAAADAAAAAAAAEEVEAVADVVAEAQPDPAPVVVVVDDPPSPAGEVNEALELDERIRQLAREESGRYVEDLIALHEAIEHPVEEPAPVIVEVEADTPPEEDAEPEEGHWFFRPLFRK